MTLRDDLVAKLEEENDLLRERCRQLEAMIGIGFEAPPVFQLTRNEAAIFGCLLKNKLCSRESLMLALYQGLNQEEIEIKIVDVFICKMRSKLKHFDIAIGTQWGQGYFLAAEDKARAMALLDQANAA